MPPTPGINWQICLEKYGNHQETAEEMLQLFADELPEMLKEIQLQHANKNTKKLYEAVHKLNGASCYIGAPYLTGLLQNFENILLNKSSADVSVELQALEEEVDFILRQVEKGGYRNRQ